MRGRAWEFLVLLVVNGVGLYTWGHHRGELDKVRDCTSVSDGTGITYYCEIGGAKHPKPELPKGQDCIPGANESMSDGLGQYKCSADGKWVRDEEAVERSRKHGQHVSDLYWALRTRVLTDKELAEVRSMGTSLMTAEPGSSNYDRDPAATQRNLDSALLLQFQIRVLDKAVKEGVAIPFKEGNVTFTPTPCALGSLCDKTPTYMPGTRK